MAKTVTFVQTQAVAVDGITTEHYHRADVAELPDELADALVRDKIAVPDKVSEKKLPEAAVAPFSGNQQNASMALHPAEASAGIPDKGQTDTRPTLNKADAQDKITVVTDKK